MPKCYLGQLDAQNDVLVLENLEYSGYKKYAGGKYFSDVDHCKIVLRRIAHFHAFSTLIQVKHSGLKIQIRCIDCKSIKLIFEVSILILYL